MPNTFTPLSLQTKNKLIKANYTILKTKIIKYNLRKQYLRSVY